MTTLRVWMVASLGLAGCGQTTSVAIEARTDNHATWPSAQKCQCVGCTCKTAAMIQAKPLWRLSNDPQMAGAIPRLESAQSPTGAPLILAVSQDHITGIEMAPPFFTLEGPDLQGVTLWISDAEHELFKVVIDSVSTQALHFWTGPAQSVEAYELSYLRVDPPDPGGSFAYVCSGQGTESDPLWGGAPHAAIVFSGDDIDLDHVTVAPPPPDLLQVGCPGSTHARMHLSRHTEASNHDGQFPTTLDQRQAMLKMFSADYCGTGESFTTDNYPLRWIDSTGWQQPPLDLDPKHGQVSSIEAIWGPSGAVCLDTPRQVPRAQVPCALPACGDVTGWATQGHVISANPVLL